MNLNHRKCGVFGVSRADQIAGILYLINLHCIDHNPHNRPISVFGGKKNESLEGSKPEQNKCYTDLLTNDAISD